MKTKFLEYPLVLRALSDLSREFQAAGIKPKPGAEAFIERAAEVLDLYLDSPAQVKEDLMATSILMAGEGAFFSMEDARIEKDYNSHVLRLIRDFRKELDYMNPAPPGSAEARQIDAAQSITLTENMKEYAERNLSRLLSFGEPESILRVLERNRLRRQSFDYQDLGADRLEVRQIEVENELAEALKKLTGSGTKPKTAPGAAGPN